MGVADSGPAADNAGKALPGIDDAISAALDAQDTQGLSDALKSDGPEKSKVKVKAEATDDDSAGDDTSGEDAAEASASKQDEDDGFQPLTPPKHWPEADKQAFAKLTRDGQEIALKLAKNLEGGFTRKSQDLSDRAKFADSVRGLFDDATKAQLQGAGVDEVGYIRYLHSLQQQATKDPVGYIKWAMQNLGVRPEHLGISQATSDPKAQPQQGAGQDPLSDLLVDPKVTQLEAQLSKLQGIIENEQRAKAQAEHAQRTNSVNAINTQIRAFREALDDSGQLQYPHFDAVKAHMGALMDTDPDLAKMQDGPDKLKSAYEMAVWARPDLRQAFIEAEAQKKLQEAQKKRDAERAKRATAVKPSAGVVSTKPKANTLDDAISQASSKLGL